MVDSGWKDKYIIHKNKEIGVIYGSLYWHDGGISNETSMTIWEDVDPSATYFVLRLDEDPHARIAAQAYADSVRAENAELAKDIENRLAQTIQNG